MAITFADAEIEAPAGQKIDGRGLFSEQHRVVPGQHQHRRAKPQGSGLCRHPGEQRQASRDLAESSEVMLDQKSRMVAQRLGLDIVFDELPVALAGIDVRAAVAGRRAAE